MSHKPVILVCNDDGITAPGITALVESVKNLGDIVIVAPDSPQSGMGHAITVAEPLHLDKSTFFRDYEAYQCSGTPADCIKLAVDKVLHKKPDIVVSGINHGSNSSINAIYSGTVSAAMEGAIDGIPAIAFSLTNYSVEADFEPTKKYVKKITELVIKNGIPRGVLLNVNIPSVAEHEINGIKVCRQSHAKWEENFDERVSPGGRKYYWLVGNFVNLDKGEDTDEWALKHNYISMVPIHSDLTAHHAISNLNEWNLNET